MPLGASDGVLHVQTVGSLWRQSIIQLGGVFMIEDKSKKRGRPAENEMPDPIPDNPENVARAAMQGPPKRDWEYLKKGKRSGKSI